MAFVPWNDRLDQVLMQSWGEGWDGAPHVRAWHEKVVAMPSWKRSMDARARLIDEQGLQWTGIPKGIESCSEYEEKIAAGDDTSAKEQHTGTGPCRRSKPCVYLLNSTSSTAFGGLTRNALFTSHRGWNTVLDWSNCAAQAPLCNTRPRSYSKASKKHHSREIFRPKTTLPHI